MQREENEITGFLRQDASRLNACGLEISGMHLKSPAFPHHPVCFIFLLCSVSLHLSPMLTPWPLPSPPPFSGNKYYITWQDGMNRNNLFIPFSPILPQCHALSAESSGSFGRTLFAVRRRCSSEKVEKVSEGGWKEDKVQDGSEWGKWDQTRTRDNSSLCILFEVHTHRPQHRIDLPLLLC